MKEGKKETGKEGKRERMREEEGNERRREWERGKLIERGRERDNFDDIFKNNTLSFVSPG